MLIIAPDSKKSMVFNNQRNFIFCAWQNAIAVISFLSYPMIPEQKEKDKYYYNQYNYYQYYYRVIFTLPEMSKRHFLKCHNHTCRSVNSQVTDRKG